MGQRLAAKEFELARKRAKQQTTAQTQQQKEAIARRFASLGGLSSGARIKTEQQAEEAGSQRLQAAEESIGAAERREQIRRQDIKEQREFQTGERIGSQEFAEAEAEKGRVFAGGERRVGEKFQSRKLRHKEAFYLLRQHWAGSLPVRRG